MNVDELRARIRKLHAEELEGFRAWFMGPDGRTTAETIVNPLERKIPNMGQRSLTDRHVDITIVADVADTAWMWNDEKLSGLCATVSFAGHHRQLGTRVSLPSGECDAWASEIMGEESAPYLYRAGTLSGAGRMSSVYYRLFLDKAGNPGPKPESVVQDQLRHISGL